MNKSKVFNISLIIFIAIFLWLTHFIIEKEKSFINSTHRMNKPTLLWSKIDLHDDYLMMTSLKTKPLEIKEEKKLYKCIRPPYQAEWRNNDDVEINKNSKAKTAETGERYCPIPAWASYGEFLNINDRHPLHKLKSERDTIQLLDKDENPLLDKKYSLKVINGISEGYFTVDLTKGKNKKCNINYEAGRYIIERDQQGNITDRCLFGEADNIVLSMSNENNLNEPIAEIKATASGLTFKAIGSKWSVLGNQLKKDTQVFLSCADGTSGVAKKLNKLNHDTIDTSISCVATTAPQVETERLAFLASKQSLSPKFAKVTTTIDKKLDIALNQMLQGCNHCEITMMNAKTGEILGLASSPKPINSSDVVEVDNFTLKSPGSIAKILFSKAVLAENPELKSFEMHNVSPDYYASRNPQSCRLLNSRVESCGENSKSFAIMTHAGVNNWNFKDFITRSENVYAVGLLYLGSTVKTSSSCPDVTAYATPNGSWTASINGQPVSGWLSGRVSMLDEGGLSCIASEKVLPWYQYMVEHMNLGKVGGKTTFRSYIWGGLPELQSALSGLSPQQELAVYAREPETYHTTGYIKSGMYKWAYGGGDSRWSNIAVAEQVSSIIAKRDIKAMVVKSQPSGKDHEGNDKSADNEIIEGMKAVVFEPSGTAHSLCSSGLNCNNGVAVLPSSIYGNLVIMAKTGTPKSVVINNAVTPRNSRIFRQIEKGDPPARIYCTFDELNQACSQLTPLGESSFMRIWQTYISSYGKREAEKSSLKQDYMNWLAENRFAKNSEGESGPEPEEGGNSEKRLVFVIAQPAMNDLNSNEFSHACTFMTTTSSSNIGVLFGLAEGIFGNDEILEHCKFEKIRSTVQ